MTKFSAPEAIKKKSPKKAILGTFWKTLTKKLRFFGTRFPLKISIDWHEGAFRKILRSASQKWISRNSKKGDPLGRLGVESPPKSATGCYIYIYRRFFVQITILLMKINIDNNQQGYHRTFQLFSFKWFFSHYEAKLCTG